MHYGATLSRGVRAFLCYFLSAFLVVVQVGAADAYVEFHATTSFSGAHLYEGSTSLSTSPSGASGGPGYYAFSYSGWDGGTLHIEDACGGTSGSYTVGNAQICGGNYFWKHAPSCDGGFVSSFAGCTLYTGEPTYTNYTACFCYTNHFATYIMWNPRQIFDDGTYIVLDPLPLAPGAGNCFCRTNAQHFILMYGDPLFATDDPIHVVNPATNIVGVVVADGGNSPGASPPGPIVGNGADPAQGGNARGGTNPLQQIDLNRAADGIILGAGQNADRIVNAINRMATNSWSTNDSEVLRKIQTNTLNSANLAAQQNAAAILANATAVSNSASAISTASNYSRSVGAFSLDYSGSVTGASPGVASVFKGSGVPSGFGLIVVDTGLSPISDFTMDLGSALNGSALNPYMGTGWRGWLRLFLLWLLFIGMLVTYSRELRQGVADFMSSSQIQVNAEAAGAVSEVPGVNWLIRSGVVFACVAVIALFPSLVAVMVSTAFGVASSMGGMGFSSISSAVGALTSWATAPTGFAAVFSSLNSMFPLVESVVFAINYWGAMLLIDAFVAMLCTFFKLVGV